MNDDGLSQQECTNCNEAIKDECIDITVCTCRAKVSHPTNTLDISGLLSMPQQHTIHTTPMPQMSPATLHT